VPNPADQPCPAVPMAPAGADLRLNIADAERNMRLWPWGPAGAASFYAMVHNTGPWDYKQVSILDDFGELPARSPFEDFGNFNYGAAGAAAGFPLDVLLRAAGAASLIADPRRLDLGLSVPWGAAPYGDTHEDQAQIRLGFSYYVGGCAR